jgi:hypothetical protein
MIKMEIQEALDTLRQIAGMFSQEAKETKAIETACHSLILLSIQEAREQFEHFIKTKDRPLNGLELIKLRVYGIDIPDAARTPEIMELASEIDTLATKLRLFQPSVS